MTVQAAIFGKNIEITQHITDYVTKKIDKIDRFLTDIDEIRVDLSHIKTARNTSDRNVAQFTIRGRGFILRTEERADDLYTAIDAALEKMYRQIEKLKGRRQRGRGDGKPASEVVGSQLDIIEQEEMPIVVRRKQFTLIPMNEQEALAQMNLLGHEDFFVFYNADSSQINILYKRRDGSYGLIEPLIG
jgi:putative sigma-54 modulation protein